MLGSSPASLSACQNHSGYSVFIGQSIQFETSPDWVQPKLGSQRASAQWLDLIYRHCCHAISSSRLSAPQLERSRSQSSPFGAFPARTTFWLLGAHWRQQGFEYQSLNVNPEEKVGPSLERLRAQSKIFGHAVLKALVFARRAND